MESNELIRGLLLLGSVAAAVTGIAALALKLARIVKRVVSFFKNMQASVDVLVKHDREQYLSILRLTIMNDQLPLSERIIAGEEYLKEGGNGDVRHFYEEHLKPYDKIDRKERTNE